MDYDTFTLLCVEVFGFEKKVSIIDNLIIHYNFVLEESTNQVIFDKEIVELLYHRIK